MEFLSNLYHSVIGWFMNIGLFFCPDDLSAAKEIAYCLIGLIICGIWYVIVSIELFIWSHFK